MKANNQPENKMKPIAIETPVSYEYSKYQTRYGIVIAIEGDRAQVQFQAVTHKGENGFSERKNIKTWIRMDRLTIWADKLELREGVTLNPDGLEYYTTKAA